MTSSDKWQPIETAPKTDPVEMEAKVILGFCPGEHPNDRVRVIWWEPKLRGGIWYDDRDLETDPYKVTPTHWMPLPAPPDADA